MPRAQEPLIVVEQYALDEDRVRLVLQQVLQQAAQALLLHQGALAQTSSDTLPDAPQTAGAR